MKEQYRELFAFNRSQRRGILVLVTFILLVTAGRIILNWSSDDVFSTYTTIPPVSIEVNHHEVPTYVIKGDNIEIKQKPLRPFNPNSVSKTELMEFGFSHRQAAAFVKFRSVIGGYQTNEQVAKVYGMTPELLERIVPYMGLTATVENEVPSNNQVVQPVIIDINTADSAQLTSLPGIGPVFARRIVRYRDRIGGYVDVQQLQEVYGMREETLEKIQGKVEAKGEPVSRNINAMDVKEIRSLPYITNWNQARAVFNYREQHGAFQSKEDLLKIKLLDSLQVNKMMPYIRFND